MDLRRVDLNLLLLVDALLTEVSASRAARRLRLSQPAVSQGLKRAREAFGDALLARHGNRLLPTPRAIALQPEIRGILERIEGVLTPSAFEPATATRDFILASSDLGQALVLPSLIARVSREAPSCRVKVVPPPARLDAVDQCDLAIMGAPVTPGPVRWSTLFEDRFVLLGRRDHPALSQPLQLEAFTRLPQVLVSPRAEGFEGPVDVALARLGLRRQVAVMLHSFMTLPGILADSDLVAAVPLRFAQLPLARESCSYWDLPLDVPRYAMKIVWHVTRTADPSLEWLRRQFVSEPMSSDMSSDPT
jgi:DNA-binding transcriptional LysR family regulator